MSHEPMQETGCPHDFGATVQCPWDGTPRSMHTSEWVTKHYQDTHDAAGWVPYSMNMPYPKRPSFLARLREAFRT